MNKGQVSGKVETIAGRVKQAVGEAAGNQNLANEGVVDQAKGAARETWGKGKEAASKTTKLHQDKAKCQADTARAKVRDAVERAKNKVGEKVGAHKEQEQLKNKTA